jgi:hypothetical protein
VRVHFIPNLKVGVLVTLRAPDVIIDILSPLRILLRSMAKLKDGMILTKRIDPGLIVLTNHELV